MVASSIIKRYTKMSCLKVVARSSVVGYVAQMCPQSSTLSGQHVKEAQRPHVSHRSKSIGLVMDLPVQNSSSQDLSGHNPN